MNTDYLLGEAQKWRGWFFRGQALWSAAHYGSLFGSIICSVAAGALIHTGLQKYAVLATALTSAAAVLTGLGSSGGFERKWRSNRLSRGRIDSLLLDLHTDAPNLPHLVARLKDIVAKHDNEIVGERPPLTDALSDG